MENVEEIKETPNQENFATAEDARRLRQSIDVLSTALNRLVSESLSKTTETQIENVYRLFGAAQSFLAQSSLAADRLDEHIASEQAKNQTTTEEQIGESAVLKDSRKRLCLRLIATMMISLVLVCECLVGIVWIKNDSNTVNSMAFLGYSAFVGVQMCILYGALLCSFFRFGEKLGLKNRYRTRHLKQTNVNVIR